jgi:EspG family
LFTLSVLLFEVLWEELRLPPMPAPIAVVQHGATLEERARIRVAALAEADRLGLGTPPRLDGWLAASFDLLARHTRAVSLRELAGLRRRAYAVSDGPRGALAVVQGDRVSVSAIRGEYVVDELLALLPPLPAGPGGAVAVPSGVFELAMQSYTDGSSAARDALRAAGLNGKDAARLLTVGRQALSSGSIGLYQGAFGDVRLLGSMAYADTADGRYAIVRRADHAGRPYTSVIPTDLQGLRRRVHGLFADHTRA